MFLINYCPKNYINVSLHHWTKDEFLSNLVASGLVAILDCRFSIHAI